MGLSRECNLVINELIADAVASHRNALGEIDRAAVASAVRLRLHDEYPLIAEQLHAVAETETLRSYVNRYFREAKDPFVVIANDHTETMKAARQQVKHLRGFVVFRDASGAMVTKPRVDVTKAEIPYVIQYLTTQRDAFQRELDWWGEVYLQMELVNAADNAPVGDFVDEADAA